MINKYIDILLTVYYCTNRVIQCKAHILFMHYYHMGIINIDYKQEE